MREHRKYLAAMCVGAGAAVLTGAACAAPPVPFYNSNVTKIDEIDAGSVVIKTKDSLGAVCAWYRKHLADANGEKETADGALIFYTHNGATVDVEPGNRFAPDTGIGLVWDARKYGMYTPGR